jgi:hypothetical protein
MGQTLHARRVHRQDAPGKAADDGSGSNQDSLVPGKGCDPAWSQHFADFAS